MKNTKKTEELALKLKVTEALSKDVGRAYARMGPEDLEKLQVAIGDIVEVVGKRTTVCKAMPAYKEMRGRSRMQLDGISRENAGAGIDDFVQVKKIACRPGNGWFSPPSPLPRPRGTFSISAVSWTACRC
jgi:transitional endoplasmic reticulum ATPase